MPVKFSQPFIAVQAWGFITANIKISAYADGGPRSRVCAWETLRSAPHRRTRKFSAAPVCRITFKYLPQLLTNVCIVTIVF